MIVTASFSGVRFSGCVSQDKISHTRNHTKVKIHWKMPLTIHWTFPVKIHWTSDNIRKSDIFAPRDNYEISRRTPQPSPRCSRRRRHNVSPPQVTV